MTRERVTKWTLDHSEGTQVSLGESQEREMRERGRFSFRSWQLEMQLPEMTTTREGTGLRSVIINSVLDMLSKSIIKLIYLPVRCY